MKPGSALNLRAIIVLAVAALASGCATPPAQPVPPVEPLPPALPVPRPTLPPPAAVPAPAPLGQNDTQVGRYSTVTSAPAEADANPMAVIAKVHFPRGVVNTVGDAVRYVLIRTGYKLVAEDALDARVRAVFALRLPDHQRVLGGDTTAYNGSCCYGILQLNTSNIIASGSSVSQYRYAPLQDQVNAWSMIESQALKDPVIQRLLGMSTFDGHPVDASMVIACVQLGQGNCRTMINSGRCDGFKDLNGTTICSMAAQMDAAMSGTGTGGAGTGTGAGSGSGTGGGGGSYAPGAGLAPDLAFQQGSGVTMAHASEIFKVIVAAFFLMWLAWTASATWGGFTTGKHTLPDMTKTIGRATVVVMMVIWLVN